VNRADDSLHDEPSPGDRNLFDELSRLAPRRPSAALRARVAVALADPAPVPVVPPPPSSPSSGRWRWLAERLAWAGAGAVAATLLAGLAAPPSERIAADAGAASNRTDPGKIVEHAAGAEAPAGLAPVFSSTVSPEPVAEESLAWSDEGVRSLAEGVPAHIYRHWVLERHPVAAGGGDLVLPREDVFVVPVSLR